jgi:hypothetical protein
VHLYEILVPTVSNEGKPFRTRYHRVWDEKVRQITGGLTVLSPVKGYWTATSDTVYREKMIPVRIACNINQIQQIADMTAKYYNQKAIMYYLISTHVIIKNYDL